MKSLPEPPSATLYIDGTFVGSLYPTPLARRHRYPNPLIPELIPASLIEMEYDHPFVSVLLDGVYVMRRRWEPADPFIRATRRYRSPFAPPSRSMPDWHIDFELELRPGGPDAL